MKKMFFAAALVGAAMMTACGNEGGIRMGSLSELDTLSYAVGCDLAYGLGQEMRDVPLDYKKLEAALQEAALDTDQKKAEESVQTLQSYFMEKRYARAQQIYLDRLHQDSLRMAAGDSTRVEYPVADPAMFESEQERADVSYALGYNIGSSIAQSGLPLQLVWITEAMDNVRDENPILSREEAYGYMEYYMRVKIPAENAAASEAWLEKIEKKSGVQKTESGLLYKVTKEGDPNVKPTDPRDVVKVHYTGRTREGKVFDTSLFKNRTKEQQEQMKQYNPEGYDKDTPAEFPLNRVIKGWTEGMQLVGKGGKITLWIPAELAYGPRGAGRDIGPNEALEFEIELLDVTPYQAPKPDPTEEPEAAEE